MNRKYCFLKLFLLTGPLLFFFLLCLSQLFHQKTMSVAVHPGLVLIYAINLCNIGLVELVARIHNRTGRIAAQYDNHKEPTKKRFQNMHPVFTSFAFILDTICCFLLKRTINY